MVPSKVLGAAAEGSTQKFNVFHIQKGMTLAPSSRVTLTSASKQTVDTLFDGFDLLADGDVASGNAPATQQLLARWKGLKPTAVAAKPAGQHSQTETEPAAAAMETAVVEIDVEVKVGRVKMRLYQFSEDRRPPYYGSMSKRSKLVTGRRPYTHEENVDYEYDSGEDWEEEEEGDDCASGDEDEPVRYSALSLLRLIQRCRGSFLHRTLGGISGQRAASGGTACAETRHGADFGSMLVSAPGAD